MRQRRREPLHVGLPALWCPQPRVAPPAATRRGAPRWRSGTDRTRPESQSALLGVSSARHFWSASASSPPSHSRNNVTIYHGILCHGIQPHTTSPRIGVAQWAAAAHERRLDRRCSCLRRMHANSWADVLHDRQHLQKDLALFWRYWKNRALDQLTACGEDRPMQTGVAH